MNDTKEVLFDQYCATCVHFKKGEEEDPCHECLTQGHNIDSHKPIMYKEAAHGNN